MSEDTSIIPASFHATIHGRVQGVCFRKFTINRALECSVSGTVQNLADGSVEVIAEGTKENLEKLVQAVRTGPQAAVVNRVDIGWGAYTGRYRDFSQIG